MVETCADLHQKDYLKVLIKHFKIFTQSCPQPSPGEREQFEELVKGACCIPSQIQMRAILFIWSNHSVALLRVCKRNSKFVFSYRVPGEYFCDQPNFRRLGKKLTEIGWGISS